MPLSPKEGLVSSKLNLILFLIITDNIILIVKNFLLKNFRASLLKRASIREMMIKIVIILKVLRDKIN